MGTRFLAYDWFKLIVLLLLIALLITLSRCSDLFGVPIVEILSQSTEAAALDEEPVADVATSEVSGSDEVESTTQQEQATDSSAFTESQVEPQTVPGIDELTAACTKALPVRLSGVGIRARVVNAAIPIRRTPEVANNIILLMEVGTEVEIISLPVCTNLLTGANNWWEVRNSDGKTGYAAEGSAIKPVYYLEEIFVRPECTDCFGD